MTDGKIIKGLAEYSKHFQPEAYTSVNSSLALEFNRNALRLMHETFSALEPGERLLDVGSGPGIKNVLSASAKFQIITLSDPLPQNTEMLQKYMDDVTEDERWREHFRLTAQLEGDADRWPEVAARMRARIQRVAWCDILQDAPLGEDQPQELYDCVLATMCLCTANANGDAKTYARSVKNLVSLAKPGGHVVIADAIIPYPHFYHVGGLRFGLLNVSEQQCAVCVEAAGCAVLSVRKIGVEGGPGDPSPVEFFVVRARKI